MWASVHVHVPPVGSAPGWCLGRPLEGGGGGGGLRKIIFANFFPVALAIKQKLQLNVVAPHMFLGAIEAACFPLPCTEHPPLFRTGGCVSEALGVPNSSPVTHGIRACGALTRVALLVQ